MKTITRKELIKDIIDTILSCSDGKYVSEIFAKDFSFRDGEFTDLVNLMIEFDFGFKNTTLYDTLNDLEDESYPFHLILSTEPDTVERSHGIVLWKRGQGYLL